ncbi:MAG TPA: YicC/YloC family endoribonuclease, partial [Coxiellaceae bacterium]|nr:YicC/YloC family endoribonuclease [Coxiellaceae bacterium]
NLHLSEVLRFCEKEIRETIQHSLGRGKVDLSIKFQASGVQVLEFEVNDALITKLSSLSQNVATQFANAQINVMDLLNWPGVLKRTELNTQELKAAVLSVIKTAMTEFIATRQREGAGIANFLKQCLSDISTHMATIKERLPLVLKIQRDKILARFAELELNLDVHRLEQEFVWLAQKTDIAEELQRLEAHVQEVERIVNEGGVVGRRLDFLMQELNREANTIGSKSMDSDVTRADVELKVLIEQMREQVQNLE